MENSSVICFGPFEADLCTRELRKHGLRLKLQEQPFRVLVMLAERPGELVTREEIRAKLWPQDTFLDFDHGLNAAVRRLREALNDNAVTPRFVETLPRRGYRFIAPVEQVRKPDYTPAAVEDPQQPDEAPILPRWGRPYLIGTGLVLFALLLAFSAGPLRDRIFSKGPPSIHSIAILPLENLSGSPEQEYFANGMTDELITEVSKISALRVIARTSSMAYKGSKKPLGKIARELNVDAVVEGTIEEAGGKVRINAQLVDASTGRNLWAASYERDSQDVLSLQSDVAEAIAKTIQAKVTPEEKQRLHADRTVNPAAHDAYLRGRYLLDQRDPTEALRSTQYFRKAIELDPGYARAYAGLSMSLVSQTFVGAARADDVMPEARAAARHALQLDPNSGEAYTALGAVEITFDWDWRAAKQNLERATQLNPSDAWAQMIYALYLVATGKAQDAVAHSRQAVRLDPVSFFANRLLASMLYYARRYDAALAQLQRAEELQKNLWVINNWRTWIYEKEGMRGKAVRADLRLLAASGEPAANLDFYRSAYTRGGWRGYWKTRIQHLLQGQQTKYDSYDMVICYLHLGNRDRAIRWLSQTVDRHSIWAIFLAVDPEMDPIRSDPRFQAILRRMNFPK